MATKKTTKTTKTTAAKRGAKNGKLKIALLDDGQKPQDKFSFLYILFACTTLIFAGVSVWLFQFSSDILNKYEEIDACARTQGATCEIHTKNNDVADESVVDITTDVNEE